jgi:hypothetical protein
MRAGTHDPNAYVRTQKAARAQVRVLDHVPISADERRQARQPPRELILTLKPTDGIRDPRARRLGDGRMALGRSRAGCFEHCVSPLSARTALGRTHGTGPHASHRAARIAPSRTHRTGPHAPGRGRIQVEDVYVTNLLDFNARIDELKVAPLSTRLCARARVRVGVSPLALESLS